MNGLDFIVRIGFPENEIEKVDSILAANDQPLFSDLRKRWSRDYRRIVRAGKLRNPSDEAFIREIISSGRMHYSESNDLNQILNEYKKLA